MSTDEHHTDQLLIFMIMAKGKSVIRSDKLSLHTQTQIALIKQFLPELKLEVNEKENEVTIEIEGLGMFHNQ